MQEYQKRVVAEQKELNDKIVSLTKFMATPAYRGLQPQERNLLLEQHQTMSRYHGILAERIILFEQAGAVNV